MFKDWRGFARSAALVASGGLVVFCVLKLLPGRTPRVESQVNFGFAEPFALPIPAPPTSSEKFSVSFSLAVRCNYTEVEALPYLLESISMQTVLPDETVVVLTQTLEDGLGETLMDLAFGPPDAKQKTGRTDLHVTQDELTSMSLQEIAAKVKNGTQPIELSVRLIPNLKFVMRAGHYSPDVDGLFAVSQTRNTTDLISVIDCNDYLHPKRTELIAKIFAYKTTLQMLSHLYLEMPLSNWYKNGPSIAFTNNTDGMETSRDVSLGGANSDVGEYKFRSSERSVQAAPTTVIGWPSVRRPRLTSDTKEMKDEKVPYFLSGFEASDEGWEIFPTTLGLALNIHGT